MEKSAGGPRQDGDSGTDGSDRAAADAQQSPPALLETLAARVPEPVVVVGPDLDIVVANESLTDLVGLSSSVVVGEPVTWLFPSLSRAAIEENCRADTGEYLRSPSDGASGDGWVELAFDEHRWDDRTYYVGVVHDVTDRHEREQMLEQYERIVETIEDGVYTLDETFTIQTVNSAVESMTGHAAEDLVGESAMVLADESTLEEAARLAAQMQFGDQEVGTLTTELTTADGGTLPVETRFTTYDLDDDRFRQVGVVRDISERRQLEATLAALHDATRYLLHAETKSEVADHIVATATDVLDLPEASMFLFHPEENVLKQTAVSGHDGEHATTRPVTPDSGLIWDTFVDNEQVSFGPDSDLELGGGLTGTEWTGIAFPLDDHGVFFVRTDGEVDSRVRELIELLAASAQAALARVDRELTLRQRESERRSQNRELRQLEEVNAIIRRIDRVLVEAETVEAIEQAVCNQLAASELFSLAWIGRQDGTDLVPRSWAGDSARYLDSIDRSVQPEGGPPSVRTSRSERMTVVSAIGDGLRDDAWRTAAISQNYQSVISVPLQYDEFVYGVLTVYSDRSDAFGEMLQSVFAELGESIANAIRDVEARQRGAADTVLELDLSLGATDTLLVQLADALGTTVTCDGAVPHEDETTRLFIEVEGDPDVDVAETIASIVSVEAVTDLSVDDDVDRYELIVDGPTVAGTLTELTANLSSLTATARGIEVTLHLTTDVDVREFVERIQRRYPETHLAARREKTVPHRTHDGIRAALEERLTDRQLEVLKTSYLSGFFDWPRKSTGQDVAEMLDVSQPTVNRHLRVSERKLIELLFDDV
ncbi:MULTISPECIES: bacterio-opsin activator domain-containing protein [Haloarcula]|uniref:bacterio-opsin activator domain-containing protein n=1 Tax=Haloarcula TaxID=2237 RepID=UPI0023EDED5C|nr:bacterio-opsin activator domain-containing protein [Halomicroarcula sp. XH51]